MEKSYKNVTTVSLHPDKAPLFHEAAAHYRFRNLAAFFRDCGLLLIHHYRRGDKLAMPLAFETYASQNETKVTPI